MSLLSSDKGLANFFFSVKSQIVNIFRSAISITLLSYAVGATIELLPLLCEGSHDNTYGNGCVPIKVYSQKQVAGKTQPALALVQ